MAKILWLSDFDIQGSGYLNLSTPLCQGLSDLGHEVKVVGLGYKGQEHNFKFGIIPCSNIPEANSLVANIWNMWKFDIFIVAFDIYIHDNFLRQIQTFRPFKYIGIMPVESDPLCMTWAMILAQMDKPLIISQFGTEEAHKVGITEAEHLQIGIDSDSWKPATLEERKAIRESILGVNDDMFVVLTVADNQERKNLVAAMDSFACYLYDISYKEFIERRDNQTLRELSPKNNALYVLVTRKDNLVGWRLADYAHEIGITDRLMIFERGLTFKTLWSLYAASDVFVLTSKAEGLGMPLLEAMAMKVPCIATNCTGMRELLAEDRGYLADYNYVYRDPFGNGKRYRIDPESLIYYMRMIHDEKELPDMDAARKYVEKRKWSNSVLQLDGIIKKLRGEQ